MSIQPYLAKMVQFSNVQCYPDHCILSDPLPPKEGRSYFDFLIYYTSAGIRNLPTSWHRDMFANCRGSFKCIVEVIRSIPSPNPISTSHVFE
ncbi:hypothetical protein HMI54_013743 [Coelomomyces lativittatus]|nr:hypothetical protein HMI55_004651 [Coelomomyces lativittatus]KAJ1514673.1 hypothetical protein HMI54_013743 [Coelomomyces lativittatus]